ncbi:hypothetical protein LJC32_05905 [Oscillospiraceae bacterium OttesenSCG-928-F05]|nr:hypothetical protein [Oscillospiraceae bacterium OttesenSCG-928-F05]
MLYNVLKRSIERGLTDGMSEKIDVFFAAGKITEAQWSDLSHMLEAAGA